MTHPFVERVTEEGNVALLDEHKSRYLWASGFGRVDRVLDVACGSGIGLPYFSDAPLVVGVDRDPEAAEVASLTRAAEPLHATIVEADGLALPFRTSSFDLVVSFETIEHLRDPERFAEEIARVLVSAGTALISTPNSLLTGGGAKAPENPFHVQEFTPAELRMLLDTVFPDVAILGQRVAPSFGPCPFWDQLPSRGKPWRQLHGLRWKLQLRNEDSVLGAGARLLRRNRSLFPTQSDFVFVDRGVDRCHGLVALCRKG